MAEDYLHKLHTEENRRLHSLYLAGAGSAIAFAFHETSDRQLSWSLIPALLAVLCWGASFASGIWASRNVMSAINSNRLMADAQAAGNQPGYEVSLTFFRRWVDRARVWQEWQLWLLLAGAAFYLAGHIWHLAEPRPVARAQVEPTPKTSLASSPTPDDCNKGAPCQSIGSNSTGRASQR